MRAGKCAIGRNHNGFAAMPDRSVLLASVYVEGGSVIALDEIIRLLDNAISEARRYGWTAP